MIIFPMAGLSSRFFKAGYDVPKYMLPLRNQSVFANVVTGFSAHLGKQPFLFICRSDFGTPEFVREEMTRLGAGKDDFHVVTLDDPTRGQAETVKLGLDRGPAISPDEPVTIFNIDTIRHDFAYPAGLDSDGAGYLEVFRGEGEHWSFVKPVPAWDPSDATGMAQAVAEKNRISDLCSNGLYHFTTARLFRTLYAELENMAPEDLAGGELYVAPMYQIALEKGLPVRFFVVGTEDLEFCGTPDEYQALLRTDNP